MNTCTNCGQQMERAVEGSRGAPVGPIGLGLIGVALLFVFPAGTVIGSLLIVTALVLGFPKKKVWRCGGCGFEHV